MTVTFQEAPLTGAPALSARSRHDPECGHAERSCHLAGAGRATGQSCETRPFGGLLVTCRLSGAERAGLPRAPGHRLGRRRCVRFSLRRPQSQVAPTPILSPACGRGGLWALAPPCRNGTHTVAQADGGVDRPRGPHGATAWRCVRTGEGGLAFPGWQRLRWGPWREWLRVPSGDVAAATCRGPCGPSAAGVSDLRRCPVPRAFSSVSLSLLLQCDKNSPGFYFAERYPGRSPTRAHKWQKSVLF